jgi:hypothetical protein
MSLVWLPTSGSPGPRFAATWRRRCCTGTPATLSGGISRIRGNCGGERILG